MSMRSFFVLLLLSSSFLAQGVIRVDPSASGAGTGATWADAVPNLRTALATAVSGSEIWVVAGSHHPGGPQAPQTSTFSVPDGVALYGGFTGTETLRSQRDPELNPTYLDADLKDDDILGRIADNVVTVVTLLNTGAGTILDGFIVRGARGGIDAGGLLISGGSPQLENCVIEDNIVNGKGGGALVSGASMTFTRCIFSFNVSASGGGLHLSGAGSSVNITLDACRFVGNDANQLLASTGDGGGVYADSDVQLTVTRSLFLSNRAIPNVPNTMSIGGGIATTGGATTVIDTIFQSNTANLGGGLYSDGPLLASQVVVSGNRVVDVNNLPGGRGGGVWAQTATLEGCTIANNYAQKVAGGAVINNGTLRNSIVWGNSVAPTVPGEDPPTPLQVQLTGGADIFYSDVQGLLTAVPGEDPPNPANFPGSIEQDPQFVSGASLGVSPSGTAIANPRLAAGSPCIDAANNAGFTITSTTTDINLKPRFFDDPTVVDTGLGAAPIADMGAYEHGPWLNDLPVASFTQSVSVLTVSAIDTSTSINGPMALRIWDFGDGTFSCVPRARHHYGSNGTKTLRLRVFDVASAWAVGQPQGLVASDTQPPVVVLTTPQDGEGVTGTIAIAATATDNDIVARVEFSVGNTNLGTDLEAPYQSSWDTTTVSDGFYTIRARGFDAVGNWADATATVHVVNGAPVIDCIPAPIDLRCQLGDTLEARFHATGIYQMTYSVQGGPAGVQIDPLSGNLSWTPTAAQVGLSFSTTLSATNPSGTENTTVTLQALPKLYVVETYDRPGYQKTSLNGINDEGTVVGHGSNPGGGVQGFIWDGTQLTNLWATGWMWTFARDINNLGVVTGSLYGVQGYTSGHWDGFTWQNGSFNIGMLPYHPFTTQLDANSINDSGVVVGTMHGGAYGASYAWVLGGIAPTWPTAVTIGGDPSTAAGGINDAGQMVGSFGDIHASPPILPQIWVDDPATGVFSIYGIPGVNAVGGTGINDQGIICGSYTTCSPYVGNSAFVALAPNPGPGDWLRLQVPGAMTVRASDINDSGVVVGSWDDAAGLSHGFIATPASAFEQPDLGSGGPGTSSLSVLGYLGTGNSATLIFSGAPPSTQAWLMASDQMNPTPLVGGTIVPQMPLPILLPFTTDQFGTVTIPNIPGGGGPLTLYAQFAHEMPGGGFGFSNAVSVSFLP